MRRTRRPVARAFVPLLVLLATSIGAHAQDMVFVQVPGILGESVDADHVDWIDAYALDHGSSYPGGGGPTISEVAFLKGTDRSSPKLHNRVATSVNVGTVVVEVCRIGPPQECYYRLTLTDSRIQSVDVAGSACIDPSTSCTPSQTESVTIDFVTITWRYTQWQDGNPVGNIEECWDTVSNTPC